MKLQGCGLRGVFVRLVGSDESATARELSACLECRGVEW